MNKYNINKSNKTSTPHCITATLNTAISAVFYQISMISKPIKPVGKGAIPHLGVCL